MKCLRLICAEKVIEQMPEAEARQCFEEYRTFAEAIRRSGHFIGSPGTQSRMTQHKPKST